MNSIARHAALNVYVFETGTDRLSAAVARISLCEGDRGHTEIIHKANRRIQLRGIAVDRIVQRI